MYVGYIHTYVHVCVMVCVLPPIPGVQAGALLACGVVNSGVRNECDPALALLSDYVQNKSSVIRSGAILG